MANINTVETINFIKINWQEETIARRLPLHAWYFLIALDLQPTTNNNKIHIYWEVGNYRFDLWASKQRLNITNKDTKEKITILGTLDIIEAITKKYLLHKNQQEL